MHDLRDAVRSLRSTPVVSLDGDPVAGARDRREHGDLLDSRQPVAAHAAGQGPAPARHARDADGTPDLLDQSRSGNRSASASACSTARSRGRARASICRAVARPRSSTACGPADGCSTCSACPPSSAGRSPTPTTAAAAGRRPGRGHQLRLLAAPLRRRRRRDRPHADRRTRAVHDRRRHAAAVLRRRRRPHVRRGHPDRHRAADVAAANRRLDGRSSGWLNIMARLKPSQSRAGGRSGAARRTPADS